MRWMLFAIAVFIALAVERSVVDVLQVSAFGVRIAPSVAPLVVVMVAMFAPKMTALWACWIFGVLLDLVSPIPAGEELHRVIGPHALGYVFACYLILQLRSMVFRRRALTVGVMTSVVILASSLVVITTMLLRSLVVPDMHWSDVSPGFELLRQSGIAIYSGLIAIPLGWLLLQTLPMWGFQSIATHSPTSSLSWR